MIQVRINLQPFSWLIAILLILLSSCRVSEESQRVVHPISNLIPGIDDSHDFDSPDYNSQDLQDAGVLAQNLLSSEKKLTLGVLEGESYEMFGHISAVKLDSEGNIYILDSGYSEVRVFNSEGIFLYSVGSEGRGPGEFFYPKDMEVDTNGRIIVVDRARRKTIFEQTGSTHQYEETRSLSVVPVKLCNQGGIVYVQGVSVGGPSNVIFSYSSGGDSLGAFGSSYKSSSDMVQSVFGEGHIACSRDPSQIIYAPRLLPIIYSYSLEGEIQWVAKISDFEALKVIENKRGDSGSSSVSMNLRSSMHDQISGIIALPQKYAIVQVASITPESVEGEGEKYAVLRSYVMLSKSGEAVYIGDSLPRIIAITKDHFYVTHSTPHPQISVYSYNNVGD